MIKKPSQRHHRNRLLSYVLSIIVASTISFVVSASYDHYDQLPDLGSKAANLLTDSEAKKLGQAFIRQSRYQLDYVNDPELVNYVNRLGQTLVAASDKPNKQFHFYLINNEVINAFAVPGGHIAMHTGILIKAESESEFASVVAHEIAHITQRHIARKLETSRYDSFIALGALLAAVAAGGSDAAQAAFGLANASIIDKQLTYSRSFEAEADALGIRLLSKSGFRPSAMPRFFKRLLDESRLNESHAPEFFRSHPLTINRITETSERARAYPDQNIHDDSEFKLMQAKATAGFSKTPELVRDQYKIKIEQGDNSLATRYGYALALSQSGNYEQSRTQIKEILEDHPGHISVRLIQAENELSAKNINQGLKYYSDLYEEQIAQGNHLVDLYYANALVLSKNHDIAIPVLRSAIANDPEEPILRILLARSYGETNNELDSFRERGEFHFLRGNYEFSLQQFQKAKRLAKSNYDKARINARIEDAQYQVKELKKLRR